MNNLQDLINLAKADGGKFFVIDESGETRLVILPVEEYQKMLLVKLQKQVQDIENINKEIIRAQLNEGAPMVPVPPKGPTVTTGRMAPRVDLRAEVIDPSFDFEGPKAEIDDL